MFTGAGVGNIKHIAPFEKCLTDIGQAEILSQLFRDLFKRQIVEPGGEVDHNAGCPTAEAVEIFLIPFRAGILVIVERAAGHAVPLDLNPIHFRRFSDSDRLFYSFKNIQRRFSS